MARASSKYVCQQCGYESAKWLGKCPECNEWNSLVETIIEPVSKTRAGRRQSSQKIKPKLLSSIKITRSSRVSTKISELDRALGGGIVSGQVILVAGEPGIGKSTILLQLAQKLGNALYVSGEESVHQIALRAQRLGVTKKTIQIVEETDIDEIISLAATDPQTKLLIIDSIQTMTVNNLSGMAGSIGQVRESAYRLVRLAKTKNMPIFLVGHVTKQGAVAGPAVLMHLVDTVLWFEGDKNLTLRLLRAVKNRFGPTDEVGIFTMEEKGLISVNKINRLFLSQRQRIEAGSVITSVLEGTRPILVEIQSLVVPTKMVFPRRVAQGINTKKLEVLLAVLQKKAGLPLNNFDVYVNVVGGVKISEPAADLAIALSLASSYFEKPLPRDFLALGEVGLLGEVRETTAQEKRLQEARRQGFKSILTAKEARQIRLAIKKTLK